MVKPVALFWSIAALLFSIAAVAEKVAITFDDLPINGALAPGLTEADIVKRVLTILAAHDAPPSFGFVNAKRFEGNPNGAEAMRLWVASGQRVGNHTYSHPDLSRSSPEDFSRDIAQNEPVLLLLSPQHEWRWFRYPYLHEGETLEKRAAIRSFLRERGYRIAQVTIDYEDYLWNSPYARCLEKRDAKSIEWLRKSYLETAAGFLEGNREMAQRVYGRRIDHVLLLHLGAFSPEILPELLSLLKQKNFQVATLEEAQRDTVYESDPGVVHSNTGSLLEQHMDARKIPYPKLPSKPRLELDRLCR
jgi:peptidoglycan/xylan/chitin deacetylase (PgdA/CDA1 family)